MQFFSCTSHISSAQESHVASGSYTRQHRGFPSLDSATLD